jgi:hypothetical protein
MIFSHEAAALIIMASFLHEANHSIFTVVLILVRVQICIIVCIAMIAHFACDVSAYQTNPTVSSINNTAKKNGMRK